MPLLDNVAYLRAWELIPYYDHTRPDGSRCFTAYEGIDYSYAAENIAAGYRTPEAVVDGWMNSPGHRANILNPELQYLGVGFYCDTEGIGTTNYKYYWSQNFCSLW
ncbi:MAG: CAP domain-containing protein [Oscillospiraceae bacterium]